MAPGEWRHTSQGGLEESNRGEEKVLSCGITAEMSF